MTSQPGVGAARPWWTCALVPLHVVLGSMLLALLGSVSAWFLIPYLLLLTPWAWGPAIAYAWVVLAATRRSPWRSPPTDAAIALVLGLALTVVTYAFVGAAAALLS